MQFPLVHTPGGKFGRVWRQFCEFEWDQGLFWEPFGGIRLWERIRVPVFHRLLEKLQLMEPLGDPSTRGRFRSIPSVMSSVLTKRPSSKPVDIVFIGHPRRQLHDDGQWWDIYCDPIIEQVVKPAGWSYLLLERPYKNKHYTPSKTSNIGHLDAIALQSAVKRKIRRHPLGEKDLSRLQQIEHALKHCFGVEVAVESMARRAMSLRSTQLTRYRALLERLNPKLVVLVVSYGNETIVEACRQLGITTAELQHGNVDEVHPGYSFPRAGTYKSTFPDYYLTFGEYWRDVARLPLPQQRIIPIGFPYLEAAVNKWKGTPRKHRALFLSQESIATPLSQCAAKLAQKVELGFEVVYKLHPAETQDWQQRYPWLVSSPVRVVAEQKPSLHELMATSKVQIGVYSTALYEGLAFGLPTYIYDLPTASVMRRLVETLPGLNFFRDTHHLGSLLAAHRQAPLDHDFERIFATGSIQRVRQFLEQVVEHSSSTLRV